MDPKIAPIALFLAFLAQPCSAEGWPQWLGPARDGSISSPGEWPDSLGEETLVPLWKTTVAKGYSGPVSLDGRVYTTSTRNEAEEIVEAFDLERGTPLWSASWKGSMKVPFFAAKNGSWIRSTPSISDGAIYVGGMRDVLVKLDAETGGETWRVDFTKRNGTDIPSFGQVSSPLVDGDSLYVQAGLAVAKLDATNGETLWRSLEDERAMFGSAFSSPIIATIAGQRQLVVQARLALHGLDLETGEELWSIPVKAFRGMNIVTPTVIGGNRIFTATYGGGAFLFTVERDDDGAFTVKQTWNNEKAEGYMGTPVHAGDHVYLHGRDQRLHCLSLDDGSIAWSSDEAFGQYWSMVHRGNRVLALDQRGELLLLDLGPDSFEILDRRKVGDGKDTWAHLGVDGDRVLVRSIERLDVYRWK